MEMKTTRELLEELKQIDRKTWDELERWDAVREPPCEDEKFLSDAIIQRRIQIEIEKNGWWLEQSTFTAKPSAKIQKREDPFWKSYGTQAETHTDAILAAYIIAYGMKS